MRQQLARDYPLKDEVLAIILYCPTCDDSMFGYQIYERETGSVIMDDECSQCGALCHVEPRRRYDEE